MAEDWIKMRIDLQTHPKIVRILSATKSDKFRVIGGLHAVWSVFDLHSEDGELRGYTCDLMDHIIGWPGFSAAMKEAGWLIETDTQLLIMPEFIEHNGKSAKRRAEDTKRKRNARKEDETRTDCGQIADRLRTDCAIEKEKEKEKREKPSPPQTPPPARAAPHPRSPVARRGGGGDEIPYASIFEAYRQLCPGLKPFLVEDEERRIGAKRLWYRLEGNRDWNAGESNIKHFLEAAQRSPFLRGEKRNQSKPELNGWKADFNFITQEKTITKILEGGFND